MADCPFLVLIGTKAQFIKMAPILLELDREQVSYRLIYTGQHSETFELLEAAFATGRPNDELVPGMEASTYVSFLGWTFRFWRAALARLGEWRGARGGLIHGDTASTLFCAIALRLAGVPVVHVEAGLRSTRLLEPFPEELIRRCVSRMTRVHFAPDAVAASNLAGASGVVVDTRGNTLRDSLALALGRWHDVPADGGGGRYAVVSIHRSENLGNKQDFEMLMAEVISAADVLPVKFVLHPSTRERIRRSGWLEKMLQQPALQLMERMDYPDFIRLLVGSCCLLTDGGSNQEEAAMLGLPTLLLRRATERPDGLGDGIELSHLQPEAIQAFVSCHNGRAWTVRRVNEVSPSKILVDALQSHLP
jgi:UDP-N-acetylglucosamine 2-epimerase (non-hydrolysing)